MNGMIAERWQELNDGSNLAKAAETIFINFRNDSQGALNLVRSPCRYSSTIPLKYIYLQLTRHVNELNQQIATKEAALRDLRAEYDKWSWVIVCILFISSWSRPQLIFALYFHSGGHFPLASVICINETDRSEALTCGLCRRNHLRHHRRYYRHHE